MVLIDGAEFLTEEEKRLKEDRERTKYWKKWGPYVAERQWSTGMFNVHELLFCVMDADIKQSERTTRTLFFPNHH